LDLILLATRNAGKAAELKTLLRQLGVRLESLREHPSIVLPPEDAPTYRENAIEKARAASRALGVPAIGDDSGLEVDALRGEPGIRSARYAGPDATDRANNELLLETLRDIPRDRRTARFRCVLAFQDGTDAPLVVEGVCEGRVLEAPRGATGFGYDPLFLPDGEDRSFAELPPDRKNEISHRARAARALVTRLRSNQR